MRRRLASRVLKPAWAFAAVIEAAKKAPVTVGSSGTNSATHLTAELLRLKAGMQLRHVPYRGSAPALTDLMGGHVDLVGSSIASAISLIRSGEVRAVAVSGSARSPSLPDVPSLSEIGIADLDVSVWYGLLAPAGLPIEVRQSLNDEINKVIRRPDVATAFGEQGLEPAPQSPEAFAAILKQDYELWTSLISQLGIRRE